jgi:hypothetical protein
MVFSRSSNGTRINSAGLVEVCPWNLLLNTNTFSSWDLEGGALTSGFTAPDSTSTAYKYVQVPGGGLYSGSASATSGVKTASVWLKSVSGTSITCILGDGDASNTTVVSVTGDWQLFTATYTTSTSRPSVYIYAISNASGIYVWHPQLNIGSTAKPYFPTTDRLNVPRLTYQNGGGGCPSLLLEKQSTNLSLYSQDFSDGSWITLGSTKVSTDNLDPSGTNTALNVTWGTGGGKYFYRSLTGLTIGTTYTITFYAKSSNGSKFVIYAESLGYRTANFTTTSDFQRFELTYTATSTSGTFGLEAASDNTAADLIVAFAQFEASSYATSYIPTTAASATRVADYTSRSGLALTNFTFAVNFKPLAFIVELFDFEKTGGGRMFYVAVNSTGAIVFNSVSGGTIGGIGPNIPINETCKLAFKLNASTSNLTVFINGSNIGTYTTDITTFGAFFGLQSFGYNPGTQIEQIAIFPSVLTDAECISLTTI